MSNRKVIDPDEFLKCVKRNFTLSTTVLARCLGVSTSSVKRFKNRPENKPIIKEAKEYLASFSEDNISARSMSHEVFLNLFPIRKWETAMKARRVGAKKRKPLMRGLYNICKYLNVLPGKLSIDQAAKLVNEMKDAYYEDQPQIRGLYYSTIRASVRNYFMSVHNMSGLYMKNLGIGTEALRGSGKYARQKVPQPVRHRFEDLLVCKMKEEEDVVYFEALGNSKFNFSTGTRISASLAFNFRNHEFSLKDRKWSFEIFDKGKGKKIRWVKIFMGPILEDFQKYCSARFDIPIRNLNDELPKATHYLFPRFVKENGDPNTDQIRDIVRPTLIDAKIPYDDFPPTHIWRHTFAQEALAATNYNYELVASLGGWVNTRILKEHYGEMGEKAREDGLLRMMGIEIPEEKHELEW